MLQGSYSECSTLFALDSVLKNNFNLFVTQGFVVSQVKTEFC